MMVDTPKTEAQLGPVGMVGIGFGALALLFLMIVFFVRGKMTVPQQQIVPHQPTWPPRRCAKLTARSIVELFRLRLLAKQSLVPLASCRNASATPEKLFAPGSAGLHQFAYWMISTL